MSKILLNMAIGSALTIGTICFMSSKDGKKLKCKISKLMD